MCESIERTGVFTEVGNIKDGFGIGQVKTREVGVETRVGRTKVGDAC